MEVLAVFALAPPAGWLLVVAWQGLCWVARRLAARTEPQRRRRPF